MREKAQTLRGQCFTFSPLQVITQIQARLDISPHKVWCVLLIINKFRPSYGLATGNYASLITPFDQCLTRWVRHMRTMVSSSVNLKFIACENSRLLSLLATSGADILSGKMSLASRSEGGRLYSQAIKSAWQFIPCAVTLVSVHYTYVDVGQIQPFPSFPAPVQSNYLHWLTTS